MSSLRGHLLIASPALIDPNFLRTVVLIAEHDETGAMGIVINRAGELEVADAAPVLGELVEPGAVVHEGGPVQQTSIVILAQFEDPARAAGLRLGDAGSVSGDPASEARGDELVRARVFAGLAGGGPGQLEAALERD